MRKKKKRQRETVINHVNGCRKKEIKKVADLCYVAYSDRIELMHAKMRRLPPRRLEEALEAAVTGVSENGDAERNGATLSTLREKEPSQKGELRQIREAIEAIVKLHDSHVKLARIVSSSDHDLRDAALQKALESAKVCTDEAFTRCSNVRSALFSATSAARQSQSQASLSIVPDDMNARKNVQATLLRLSNELERFQKRNAVHNPHEVCAEINSDASKTAELLHCLKEERHLEIGDTEEEEEEEEEEEVDDIRIMFRKLRNSRLGMPTRGKKERISSPRIQELRNSLLRIANGEE